MSLVDEDLKYLFANDLAKVYKISLSFIWLI